MTLYYECHITIEPVFDSKLEQAKQLSDKYGFRIANLLMQKRKEDKPEQSKYDTFMTGTSLDLHKLKINMVMLINELKENGFKVWRYKIEDALVDSRHTDTYNLLNEVEHHAHSEQTS